VLFELTGLLPHGQAALTSAKRENHTQRQRVFPVVPCLNIENCVNYYNNGTDGQAIEINRVKKL